MRIVCVVEGHGDAEALPVLVRRIANDSAHFEVQVEPVRVKRQLIVKEGEFERTLELAASRAGDGAILVVLDADDDCPVELANGLLQRVTVPVDVRVVVAKREFESWLVAGSEALAGQRGLQTPIVPPPEPEAIRSPKAWLGQRGSRRYVETLDQAAFSATFDMAMARERSRSFDKFFREVVAMLSV